MYTLARHLTSREVIAREAATFMISLVVAEVFYKFHSFTLECLAFLVTWMALSALATAGGLFKGGESAA